MRQGQFGDKGEECYVVISMLQSCKRQITVLLSITVR
jgi:hypothetical protein